MSRRVRQQQPAAVSETWQTADYSASQTEPGPWCNGEISGVVYMDRCRFIAWRGRDARVAT